MEFSLGIPKPVKEDGALAKGDNPSGMMPARLSIQFGRSGRLAIVEIAAWERAFDAEPEVRRACVTGPVAELAGLLRARGGRAALGLMPMVGCVDASGYFTLQVRRVRFRGGEGFLFVTERTQEPILASNEGLVAMFQGLTDDGRTWVGGEVGVRARGLRDKADGLIDDQAVLAKAIAADAAMLAKLGPSDFEPNLDEIAEAIARLQLPGRSP
jgi:hypothetical protein